MELLQWIADTINAIVKHGWSVTTFIVALTALLRVNAVRRALLKRLPKRFRHEDKLDAIHRDIRAIKAHLGVSECAENRKSLINGESVTETHLSQFGWVTRATATIAKQHTMATRSLSKNTETKLYFGRPQTMKEYLKKLGRTKFQAFLLATFTNIGLLVGYLLNVNDVQSEVSAYTPLFIGVSQLVAGMVYQWVEGSIDKAKVTSEVSAYDAKNLDLVRQDSEGA